jgi:hypothetical protein
VRRADGLAECLVKEGELTLEKLAQTEARGTNSIYYLKFIEPLNLAELAAYQVKRRLQRSGRQQAFHAGRGRLARVGYFSRFIDALFSLSLLARGRVTGDTAASAAITYEQIMQKAPSYRYFGRVTYAGGWTVLQYWLFYPFNNWRSGFSGVNDHEADWEMICLYLDEQDGDVTPEWVAYASHEFSGDDLRRRWDDPEVRKVGEHPVVFAAAGSHAAYYVAGEYLTEIEVPFLTPVYRLTGFIREFTQKAILRIWGQAPGRSSPEATRPVLDLLRVPFVDYARGDGLTIGIAGDVPWSDPALIDDLTPWVAQYRGLWGLYAEDPVSGENAPAGPAFNRDGSPRYAWYDPLGWAGLDKVAPPSQALETARRKRAAIEADVALMRRQLEEKRSQLVALGVETSAIADQFHLAEIHRQHRAELERLSEEVRLLGASLSQQENELQALAGYVVRLQNGERGPRRAHIKRAMRPEAESTARLGRFAETWAAISIGLVSVGIVLMIGFARQSLVFGLAVFMGLLIFLEAGFRRRLDQLVSGLTITLAVLSGLVLLYEFFWEIIIFAVLLASGYITWENLRELWE